MRSISAPLARLRADGDLSPTLCCGTLYHLPATSATQSPTQWTKIQWTKIQWTNIQWTRTQWIRTQWTKERIA